MNASPVEAPPSLDEIANIVAIENPIERNLQITRAYHRISVALSKLHGGANANWCTFAVWASKTAGGFIRKENVEALSQALVKKADYIEKGLSLLRLILSWFAKDATLDNRFIAKIIEEITDEIAENISHGNTIVFKEIAELFEKFRQSFHDENAPNEEAVNAFLTDIPHTDNNAQDALATAFRNYYLAIFEKDEKAQAEQVLLANILIGLHEQIRLQPSIANSMNAPLTQDFVNFFVKAFFELLGKTAPSFLARVIEFLWTGRLEKIAARIAEEWREISTDWFMILELPEETLRLGKDVPSRMPGRMFPEYLQNLQNTNLLKVLSKFDRTPDTTTGSAAHDWAILEDRMNFIADLFRSRQQDPTLFQPPLSETTIT